MMSRNFGKTETHRQVSALVEELPQYWAVMAKLTVTEP